MGKLEDKLPYAIYFIGKKFSKVELNYTITKKEMLAIVHALKKFRHHIILYQNLVNTSHETIKYLMNRHDVNARIIIWLLLLKQFDLTIVDKPRKENVVAYFLSKLSIPADEEGMVDDWLLDEHIFAISTLSMWFDDRANYLCSDKFPPNLSSREKIKIIKKTPLSPRLVEISSS